MTNEQRHEQSIDNRQSRQDPEVRYSTNGSAICNITVATSESWKDKNLERARQNRMAPDCSIQTPCRDHGRIPEEREQGLYRRSLQTRKWQDKDGADRYTTEIVARDMQMLDSRQGESRQRLKHRRNLPLNHFDRRHTVLMQGAHGRLIKLGIEPLMTTEQVAEVIGVSRAVVQRIEKRALLKLRMYCIARRIKLRDLIDE